MSPASSGHLEVERYIGACLFSQQHRSVKTNSSGKSVASGYSRDCHYVPDVYWGDGRYRVQRCNSVDGWAGGMPLISFAGHPRRNNETGYPGSPLARLAVHTQGAPLILAKSYNHRKNKQRNFNKTKPVKCEVFQANHPSPTPDTISVTSDESSGNSENCLPRIIKPRKRRKKDRKPPILHHQNDGFSTDSPSPDLDKIDPFSMYRQKPQSLPDISETPKLHHSFDDIEDVVDINGNQSTSTCQCRYCDPSGQIWDVDRHCYSPFLTPPASNKVFSFPNFTLQDLMQDYYPQEREVPATKLSDCVLEGLQKLTLEKHSSGDLEVSSEIVTSLNGHRDIEIKFFSSAPQKTEAV